MATQEEVARGAKRNGKATKRGRLSTAFDVQGARGEVVSWGEVDPSGIVAVTQTVSSLGGAVTFGGSRDRGALQVAIFLDGDRHVRWCSSAPDAEAALSEIWEKLATL